MQSMLVQVLQDQFQVVCMFLHRATENQNIIQIHSAEPIKVATWHSVD